jgi:hypothetical protein
VDIDEGDVSWRPIRHALLLVAPFWISVAIVVVAVRVIT